MNLYSSQFVRCITVHQLIIQCNSRHIIYVTNETNAYGIADNSYFGLLNHTCNHTYNLIYQYKLRFLPTEGIYGFRKFLKMKPSPLHGETAPPPKKVGKNLSLSRLQDHNQMHHSR
jgi:hypothetical protein